MARVVPRVEVGDADEEGVVADELLLDGPDGLGVVAQAVGGDAVARGECGGGLAHEE